VLGKFQDFLAQEKPRRGVPTTFGTPLRGCKLSKTPLKTIFWRECVRIERTKDGEPASRRI